MSERAINLDHLLKLRLVVARYGEMDVSKWWNTNGMLGRYGDLAISRGLPRTHLFAQAKVVFEVARNRCKEVFHDRASITLWSLPADLEDNFESRWHFWLDHPDDWQPTFDRLDRISPSDNLIEVLKELSLINEDHEDRLNRLRRSAEGKALLITGWDSIDDGLMTLLAGGFSKGEPGKPAIPYFRTDGK